jgi:hypothetical protein
LPCPAGFACVAGTNTLTKPMVRCSPGYFCPQSSTAPNLVGNKCPDGTYSDRDDLTQASDCYDCPPGKYCTGGLTAPDGDCFAGSYCPGKATKTTVTGNYCACVKTTADNSDGCTCIDPIAANCVISSAGYKSCSVQQTGTQCPAGTYGTRTGMKAASECKICPLGSYCPVLQSC